MDTRQTRIDAMADARLRLARLKRAAVAASVLSFGGLTALIAVETMSVQVVSAPTAAVQATTTTEAGTAATQAVPATDTTTVYTAPTVVPTAAPVTRAPIVSAQS